MSSNASRGRKDRDGEVEVESVILTQRSKGAEWQRLAEDVGESWMRLVGIDVLRGVAAFGIVGCHLLLAPRTSGGDLITALCDFNVGLFAAVSGFLMCGNKGDDGWLGYVGKRARRLLPTYFFWSAVFILATVSFDLLLDGGRLNPKYGTVAFWGRVVFLGDASTHLWFLSCLFYVQILLWPVFRICTKRWHGMMWIMLGALLAWMATLSPMCFFNRYPLRLAAFLITGFGVGCLLRSGLLGACRKQKSVMWCVAVIVLALHVTSGQMIPGFIKDWLAVGPVLLTFVGWKIERERAVKLAVVLGATSLGVYLVHPLVTRALSVVAGRLVQPPFSVWVVLGDWVLAWGLSLVVAAVMRRVPGLRRVV